MSSHRKKRAKAARAIEARPAPSEIPQRRPARSLAWGALGVAIALVAGAAWWTTRPAAPAAPVAPGPTVAAPAPKPPVPIEAAFVGSTQCASCHEGSYQAWKGSHHALAMQHASEQTVLGDFGGAKLRYAGVESTFFRRDGKFLVRTDGADGKLADFEVKYAFGVDPLQQYLVEFPDGRLQALSIAWDARPKESGGQRWFHLYPKEKIDFRDELHWTKRSQNWNFMCADCHSTNLRKGYDAATDKFETAWSEISVGCEACHGPGSAHVEWAKVSGSDPAKGLTVSLDERRGVSWKLDPATGNAVRSVERRSERELEVCAQCHARRAQIAEGYRAGNRFLDHYRPALLSPGLYHADGQQRDEVYVWGSFLQSRMYRQGVTCSDCHEPHALKLRAEGNALCGQCHAASKYDAPAHHFHKPGGRGAQCFGCHMPEATYMVVDPRRDHSLRVPRPDLSASLGTPNACNGCHADRDAKWADETVQKWYGHRPQGAQRFAATLHAAARRSAEAGPALGALAGDASQPPIARATALESLAGFPSQDTPAILRRGLADVDPLVRRASLTAAASLPPEQRLPLVAPLLDDPVRTVRIEAALALASVPVQSFSPAQRASFDRAAAEFEATQRYNADRPEARTALGGFLAQRGRDEEAEREYRAAMAIEPRFAPAYANLADLRRAQARDAEAEAVLREGLKRVPDNAALHHSLGLALVRMKRTPEALRELERAAKLAPDDAGFAYVYAVALHSGGKPRDALREVDQALVRHPDDRDLLFAGATFSRDAGDQVAARRYAQRLAERYPRDPQAARLAQELAAGR
ncbi:MAG TPA: multiheme c-type cytochrome [Burkholderiales bacterium]|nr:multiheme c-type cytochrome [Burkholderiales bacterium]